MQLGHTFTTGETQPARGCFSVLIRATTKTKTKTTTRTVATDNLDIRYPAGDFLLIEQTRAISSTRVSRMYLSVV